ncbi:MAG TPA: hypothetical protein VIV15_00935 [Anaerolineales bacterium]
MGRNFLSSTELIHQVIADLKPFVEMLSPQDRIIFNKFSEHALNHRAAIANAASLLPLEATLLILLVEEHKRNQRLHDQLRAEIAKLRKAIEQLAGTNPAEEEGP